MVVDAVRQEPVCVIAGLGVGNGEAFARQFAAQSYKVGLLSRRKDRIEALAAELHHARAVVCLIYNLELQASSKRLSASTRSDCSWRRARPSAD